VDIVTAVKRSLAIALVLCALIGLGLGLGLSLGSAPGTAVPALVAQAIARTLAVKSVEVIHFPSSPSEPPTIYQAPNLYESPPFKSGRSGGVVGVVYVGDREYLVGPKGVLSHLSEPLARLHGEFGLTPAQNAVFLPLIDARLGSDFRKSGGQYFFHLAITVHTGRSGATSSVSGGSLSISGGYVRKASIYETSSRQKLIFTFTYEDFNSAPPIMLPTEARTAIAACKYASTLKPIPAPKPDGFVVFSWPNSFISELKHSGNDQLAKLGSQLVVATEQENRAAVNREIAKMKSVCTGLIN